MESRLMSQEEVNNLDWDKYAFKLVINTNELSGGLAVTPQEISQTLELKAADMDGSQISVLYKFVSQLLRESPMLLSNRPLESSMELWFGGCGTCGCHPTQLCGPVCAGSGDVNT